MATATMESTDSPPSPPFPWRVLFVSIIASLNNMAFGYDVGVVSGSLLDMAGSLDLSLSEQELATSGLNFVSGIGALAGAGFVMDSLGRRATLMVSSLLLVIGGAFVTLANSFGVPGLSRRAALPRASPAEPALLPSSLGVLLLGRALQGLGSGCAWCACSVYIAELAPKEYRGGLVAVSDIGINVGILIGYAVDRSINTASRARTEAYCGRGREPAG